MRYNTFIFSLSLFSFYTHVVVIPIVNSNTVTNKIYKYFVNFFGYHYLTFSALVLCIIFAHARFIIPLVDYLFDSIIAKQIIKLNIQSIANHFLYMNFVESKIDLFLAKVSKRKLVIVNHQS